MKLFGLSILPARKVEALKDRLEFNEVIIRSLQSSLTSRLRFIIQQSEEIDLLNQKVEALVEMEQNANAERDFLYESLNEADGLLEDYADTIESSLTLMDAYESLLTEQRDEIVKLTELVDINNFYTDMLRGYRN